MFYRSVHITIWAIYICHIYEFFATFLGSIRLSLPFILVLARYFFHFACMWWPCYDLLTIFVYTRKPILVYFIYKSWNDISRDSPKIWSGAFGCHLMGNWTDEGLSDFMTKTYSKGLPFNVEYRGRFEIFVWILVCECWYGHIFDPLPPPFLFEKLF